MFSTAVNPVRVDQHNEVQCDLENPRVAVYKNTWIIYQNTVYLCNLKFAQKKGLQFYQTRSNAIVFYNTLFAICIAKVVYVKSGEESYNKVFESPRLPRKAVLKPNLHHGRQDLSNLEARTSVTIKAKNARSMWKPAAKSSGRPESVTSTSEYKVYHTQLFKRKTMYEEKRSRN